MSYILFRKIFRKSILYNSPIVTELEFEIIKNNLKSHLIPNFTLNLLQAEKLHIKARRLLLKNKNQIYLSDGKGSRWIAYIDSNLNYLEVVNARFYTKEIKRIVCLGLPERALFEKVFLPSAIELGLTHLIPIQTQRSIRENISKERLNRISIESAEQSKRYNLPKFYKIKTIKKLILLIKKYKIESEQILVLDPYQNYFINDHLKNHPLLLEKTLIFIVGPEGGFNKEEMLLFKKENFTLINLSKTNNILKISTAALAALAKTF